MSFFCGRGLDFILCFSFPFSHSFPSFQGKRMVVLSLCPCEYVLLSVCGLWLCSCCSFVVCHHLMVSFLFLFLFLIVFNVILSQLNTITTHN